MIGFCCGVDVFVAAFLRFTSRTRTEAVTRRPGTEPHRHASEILSRCCQQELILRAGDATQSQPSEFQDAFHVTEEHLDFLAIAAPLRIAFSLI